MTTGIPGGGQPTANTIRPPSLETGITRGQREQALVLPAPPPPDTQLLAPSPPVKYQRSLTLAPVDRGPFCSARIQAPSLPSIPSSGGKRSRLAEGWAGAWCRGYRGCWPKLHFQSLLVLITRGQQPSVSPPRRTRGKLQLPHFSLSFPLQHGHKES